MVIPAIAFPGNGLGPAAVSAPTLFTLQIASPCLLQKLNVQLTEVEEVLLTLQQLEDIGNSPRLDSLYWNVMHWLNYTYVCLAPWHSAFSGACLPVLLVHREVGRERKSRQQLQGGVLWSSLVGGVETLINACLE